MLRCRNEIGTSPEVLMRRTSREDELFLVTQTVETSSCLWYTATLGRDYLSIFCLNLVEDYVTQRAKATDHGDSCGRPPGKNPQLTLFRCFHLSPGQTSFQSGCSLRILSSFRNFSSESDDISSRSTSLMASSRL